MLRCSGSWIRIRGQSDNSAAKATWHNEGFYVSCLKWFFRVLRFVGIGNDYLRLLESQSHCSQFIPNLSSTKHDHYSKSPWYSSSNTDFGGRCFRLFDNTLKNVQVPNNNFLDSTFTKTGRPKFAHSNVSPAVTNTLNCHTQINRENLSMGSNYDTSHGLIYNTIHIKALVETSMTPVNLSYPKILHWREHHLPNALWKAETNRELFGMEWQVWNDMTGRPFTS
jgi:hypothetical protein